MNRRCASSTSASVAVPGAGLARIRDKRNTAQPFERVVEREAAWRSLSSGAGVAVAIDDRSSRIRCCAIDRDRVIRDVEKLIAIQQRQRKINPARSASARSAIGRRAGKAVRRESVALDSLGLSSSRTPRARSISDGFGSRARTIW